MFDSLLIANRGEIALRIIRSARARGIRTIAVYSEADIAAPHVREADEAHVLGPGPAAESYLDIDKILAVAADSKAGAVHPGYGFLSENADFARRVEAAGMRFVGPTPEQLESFGVKHTARELANAAGVPMLPGTGLLQTAQDAVAQAEEIGLPVMVKASSGGGGIGMQACTTAAEVVEAFEAVEKIATKNFGSGGVFLERLVRPARHVEVQVFGDGTGNVAVIGDRDCSLQRRNQKVLEEAPAPDLPEAVRRGIHESARSLAASVDYRSAGTVEFIYDPSREEAYFLEMNTRLQVEHPVTEEVYGVDLVDWMLTLAQGRLDAGVFDTDPQPTGWAVEARVYAEDPAKNCEPSPGLVTNAVFPEGIDGVRVDGWVETGLEIPHFYDPMIAKVIAHADDRDGARDKALDLLNTALGDTRIDGVTTNLGLLRAMTGKTDAAAEVRTITHSTLTLAATFDPDPRIDVVAPGMLTTVQDWPGRKGYWQVGVPPSGPMDDLSLREANTAVGNPAGAPALECTSSGPTLRFSDAAVICITGAPVSCTIDGDPVAQWSPVTVDAGQTLRIGTVSEAGLRVYLAVRGGFDLPKYLGSASTFTLGNFGGHAGRALRAGDVLRPAPVADDAPAPSTIPTERRPEITTHWRIAVTEGPHEAPEFFTPEDIDTLYATDYAVHHNSARTGVRLIGPRPTWAREDGGEAGLHPSNIHDNAYAVGALDFTGDTPIILGPDGPSLGGFVCPAVVASGDLWKLGQLRPGDTIRFVPVRETDAAATVEHCVSPDDIVSGGDGDHGVLAHDEATDGRPAVTYRRAGDTNLLVEFGDLVLDIGLRMRVHALMTEIEKRIDNQEIDGVIDLTPGIRSLQIHVDPDTVLPSDMVAVVRGIEEVIPDTEELQVPSRRVRLPLSWDDPQTRLAIERYMNGVRDDAPWCPWNIEFIRRMNGLETVEDVYDTVFDASYLVLGLGDVYLGAPVATPLDPRHRLVTTKYNPARTWTPENAVGIGGAYLCIYGMEGPGGYQFVGRTTQVWNRFRTGGLFQGNPWALRFFDRIEWYPVSHEKLMDMRAETGAGRGVVDTEEGAFSYAEYRRFLDDNADSIAEFRATQATAFDEEKERWRVSGEFEVRDEPEVVEDATEIEVPEGSDGVYAPLPSTLWQLVVAEGDTVKAGDRLASLEAMKMETPILAECDGVVSGVFAGVGEQVGQGQVLVSISPA
ncbi:Urea amidolyase [Corynebacterium glyciniphilum AJ 3170]|uniref:Urea amidolyase n=1 Tax=Corynebacterium glyciniphilum AJ 3170 TaxID=1404245 RepID=X5DNA7_9CORY|nr:urea carboxylase [Corynebacterium glyciniphilum]AHW64633.1 Urea amidolyase [Corynebacterium glyciniphilum AJ 3170]